MSQEVITITVSNFQKWQKPTAKREWVAIASDFINDPKINLLMRKEPRAFAVWVWILGQVEWETQSFSMREDFLKTEIKKAAGVDSNNFNYLRYLNLLSTCGLLAFNLPSTRPQLALNCQVEQAETPVPVISNINNDKDNDMGKGVGSIGKKPAAAAAPKTEKTKVFTIVRPGDTYPAGRYTERDWLRMELVRKLRGSGIKIRADTDLETLIIQNSYAYEIATNWIRYPIEKRLAAYVYSVIEKKAVSPLEYAYRALTQGWEGMEKNINQSIKVLNAELEVKFNE